MRQGHVYYIRNTVNGNWYVGSTVNKSGNRFSGHRCNLRKDKHCNQRLQRAWNKYGEDAFICENHKTFDTEEEARVYEDGIIKEHYGKPHCYNVSTNTKQSFVGSTGRVCSEETKRKMREAAKKRWKDPEFRKSASEANRKSAVEKWKDPEFRSRELERRKRNPESAIERFFDFS